MLAGNVEVLHVVAEVVAIAEDAAARADGEREGEAVLVGVGARVHARLHDALADGLRVAEAREMPDGIEVHARLVLLRQIRQRGLDGVVHVIAVDEFVNAQALLADGVQECRRIAGQNFADGGVAEHGVQPADARGELVRRAAAAGALDGFNGVADAVDAVADGVGKVAIEQQKLENAVGSKIGGVHLAVGFERRAAAQQADQLEVLIAGVLALRQVEELRLIDLEQRGGGVGALQVAAEADELPALAVNHGGVADALEEMDAVDHRGQHVVDVGAELGLRVRRVHLVIEPVEPLPLLGGDFFAHLAGIFARRIHAVGDRGTD